MSYRDPPEIPVQDPTVRQAIREVRQALIELAREQLFHDVTVELPNNVPVLVLHGLGRVMKGYACGAWAGAINSGRVVEIDRTPGRSITLQANGMGATITMPVRFW